MLLQLKKRKLKLHQLLLSFKVMKRRKKRKKKKRRKKVKKKPRKKRKKKRKLMLPQLKKIASH
jgi:hypothetical protein